MGMMRVILDEGLTDEAFLAERCENLAALRASLEAFTLDFAEQMTGVPRAEIVAAARVYATRKPATILFAMGITQHTHGTDNVLAVSNLALLTGNVGKPSSGVNPLRGQNNVQGACDMGALPNVLPGYQKVDNADVRHKFEAAWSCSLDRSPGLPMTEVFDAIDAGTVKALYLMGENPLLSEADSHHVEKALRRVEFFVVQDIFLTETAWLADVVLPAATFAEKDGTFTNTERRVQRVRKAVDPPGEARADWQIICEVAKRMGAGGFSFAHPGEIMAEIAAVTPSLRRHFLRAAGQRRPPVALSRAGPSGHAHPAHDAVCHGRRQSAAHAAGVQAAGRTARRRIPSAVDDRPQPLPLPHGHDDAARGRAWRSSTAANCCASTRRTPRGWRSPTAKWSACGRAAGRWPSAPA